MADTYRTIEKEAEAEFVEKRSRFIGYSKPVQSEEEALAFIAQKKKLHWDATHNVYAYCLREGGIRRFSDDGEPQGTAGMPVLDVLQKEGLTDCVLVVTRYFGGILLGAGGLVRAYSHGAKLAVDAGGRLDMRMCRCGVVCCDYAQYGWVPPLILSMGGVVDDVVYTDAVAVHCHLPADAGAALEAELTDKSCGTLQIAWTDERYFPFPVPEK